MAKGLINFVKAWTVHTYRYPTPALEKWVRQAVGRRRIPGLVNPGRQWNSLRGSASQLFTFVSLHSSIARACLCVILGSPIAFGDVVGRARQKSSPFALSLSPVVPCISTSRLSLVFRFSFFPLASSPSASPIFPISHHHCPFVFSFLSSGVRGNRIQKEESRYSTDTFSGVETTCTLTIHKVAIEKTKRPLTSGFFT